MKVLVTYPDPERVVVDYLTDAFGDHDEPATVAVGVPVAWGPESTSHLQVACDAQTRVHPIKTDATIRLTAWAATTSEAKRLAELAHGLVLLAELGPTHSLTGPVATRDPNTAAELATTTVLVTLRSTTVEST